MDQVVKMKICSMLDAGGISSAESVLPELEKICPEEAEIELLKYDIEMLRIDDKKIP